MKNALKIVALLLPIISLIFNNIESKRNEVYPSDLLADLNQNSVIITKSKKVCERIGEQTEKLIFSRKYTGYINVSYIKEIRGDCKNIDKMKRYQVTKRIDVKKCYCGDDTYDLAFAILYDIKKKSEKKSVPKKEVRFTYNAHSNDFLAKGLPTYQSAGRLVTFEKLVNQLLDNCENSIEETVKNFTPKVDSLPVE